MWKQFNFSGKLLDLFTKRIFLNIYFGGLNYSHHFINDGNRNNVKLFIKLIETETND